MSFSAAISTRPAVLNSLSSTFVSPYCPRWLWCLCCRNFVYDSVQSTLRDAWIHKIPLGLLFFKLPVHLFCLCQHYFVTRWLFCQLFVKLSERMSISWRFLHMQASSTKISKTLSNESSKDSKTIKTRKRRRSNGSLSHPTTPSSDDSRIKQLINNNTTMFNHIFANDV